MTIEVLRYPLSKGEKTEKSNERVIEITESGDNRGMKPDVYLAIYKTVGKKQKQVIVEDFFLNTDAARIIGQTIINVSNQIDEKQKLKKVTPKPSVAKKSDFKCKIAEKSNIECKIVAKKLTKKK